jgi:hypothetical protein
LVIHTFRRLALSILFALTVCPAAAHAAPVDALFVEFLNSNLTFGGPEVFHRGHDVSSLQIHGADYFADFTDSVFTADGGLLVDTTTIFDGGGDPIRTDYRYEGGAFTIEFRRPSDLPAGSFTAPIVSLLIRAFEPLDPSEFDGFGSSVDASYTLAPGAFDAAFADLLGVPRLTGASALGYASMRLLVGDHASPALEADDGVMTLEVTPATVSEPAINLLVGLGLTGATLLRRRKR